MVTLLETEYPEGLFPEVPYTPLRLGTAEQVKPWPRQVRNVARQYGYPFNDGLVGRVPFQWRRAAFFPGSMSRYLGCRVTPYEGFLPLRHAVTLFPPGWVQTESPDMEFSRASLAFSYMGW
jgi:hypothetical protein